MTSFRLWGAFCFLSILFTHIRWFSFVVSAKTINVDNSDAIIQYPGNACFSNTPEHPCNGCGDQPDRGNFLQRGWHDCGWGSSFSFSFTGTSVRIVGASLGKPDYRVSLRMSIDGGSADSFNPFFTSPQQFHQTLASKGGLSNGRHTVQVNVNGDFGTVLFDYFSYDDGADVQAPLPAPAPKPTTSDNPNPSPNPQPEPTQNPVTTENGVTKTVTEAGPGATNSANTRGQTEGTVRFSASSETVITTDASGRLQTITRTNSATANAPIGGTSRETITITDSAGNLIPVPAPTDGSGIVDTASVSKPTVNVGAIVGGVVGGLLILILLAGLLIWRRKQRQRKFKARRGYVNEKIALAEVTTGRRQSLPPPAYQPDSASDTTASSPTTDRLRLAHHAVAGGGMPGYSHSDGNTESAQLAVFVSQNSDVITPDLAERLQVARYRPLYDPDMISTANWWEWFKVTPFEVGILRDLYLEIRPPGLTTTASEAGSVSDTATPMTQYSKSTEGLISR